MSTRIRVRGGRTEITARPEEHPGTDAPDDRSPFLTALVEASGALLTWDVTARPLLPDALVHDESAAGAWLDDVYGPAVAEAVRRGSDAMIDLDPSGDPAVLEALHALGHLTWARAWWPASSGIPALDPAILAAEIAAESQVVAHLLDDEDAVERAVRDAAAAPSALAALPAALTDDAARLATVLDALAEDSGVELEPAMPVATLAEWALAAGGDREAPAVRGIVAAEGAASPRWADVPAQTVDAASEASWSLRQGTDSASLHVEVAAVDGPWAAPTLRARFGPADLGVEVELEREGSWFRGTTVVPAAALFLLPADRTLWVREPSMASSPGAPEPAEEHAAVLRFAADRLRAPEASLAERAAGARE